MAPRSSAALALAAAVVLLAVAVAYAQPCIECRDCKTNNCFRQCKPKCPVKVDGDACRRRGREFGREAARSACDTTRKYCNGGQSPKTRTFGGIGPVTKRQCANIAFGQCQQTAMDRRESPCGRDFNGFRKCNGRQFMDFYRAEVDELCARKAATINN